MCFCTKSVSRGFRDISFDQISWQLFVFLTGFRRRMNLLVKEEEGSSLVKKKPNRITEGEGE